MTDPRPPQDVDGLARRLPRREPSAERSSAMRHALLDAAQPPDVVPTRSALRGWWIGTAAAAAAAVCVWLVLRGPDAPAPSATDVASAPPAATPSAAATSPAAGATTSAAGAPAATGGTQIATGGAAPGAGSAAPGADSAAPSADRAATTVIAANDRIPDGLTTFAPTHPVQMTRGTSTITAPPEARFDVEVRGDEVKRVTVMAGWVVVASARAKTTIVPTRYTWTPEAPVPTPLPPPASQTPASPASPPPATAAAAANPTPSTTRTAPSTPTAAAAASASTSPATPADTSSRTTTTATPADTAPSPPTATPSPLEAPPQVPGGSERDFRDGLRSLLAGDPRSATTPLSRACVAPSSSQDDMCYWAAVAWLRSGDHERARQAFSDMLGRWPGSTHVGEANVALGWLLLEAGDHSGARTRFAAAANDRMASIRANAVRGLAASQ